MDFSNKVVIITGGGSGIGAACAIEFAKLSAKLVLVGRNVDNLNKVADQCEKLKGIKPLVVKADISSDSDTESIVTKTVTKFGSIDILINNAGVGNTATVRDDVKKFDDIMQTNIRGPYLLTHYAVPHLIKSKGNIINISSVAGLRSFSAFTAYCISKAALDMFTKCLAQDLGPEGVRVNSVNPGLVKTNILGSDEAEVEYKIEMYKKVSPLRKIVTTKDLSDLVIFLASNNASSITGSVNIIDNGFILS